MSSINSLFFNAKNTISELDDLSVESVNDILDTLLKSLLKKNPADKKKIDENKPKKALNSYMQYCKTVRKSFQEENKEMKPKEISSLIGESWRNLSDEEKQIYIDMYLKEKSDIESGKENSDSDSKPVVKKPVSKKTEPEFESDSKKPVSKKTESDSKKVVKKPVSKKTEPKEKTKKVTKKIVPKKIIEESDSDSDSDSSI